MYAGTSFPGETSGSSSDHSPAIGATDSKVTLLYPGRFVRTDDLTLFLEDGKNCANAASGPCWTTQGGKVIYKQTGDGIGSIPYTSPQFTGWIDNTYAPGYTQTSDGTRYSLDGKIRLKVNPDYSGGESGYLDATYLDSDGEWKEMGGGYGKKFNPNLVESFSFTGSATNPMPVVHGKEHTYIYDTQNEQRVALTNEEYRDYAGSGKSILSVETSGGGNSRTLTFGAEGSGDLQAVELTKDGPVTSVTSTTYRSGEKVSTSTDTRYPGDINVVNANGDMVLSYGQGSNGQTIEVSEIDGNKVTLTDGRVATINVEEIDDENSESTISIVGKDKKVDQVYTISSNQRYEETVDFDNDGRATAAYGRANDLTFQKTMSYVEGSASTYNVEISYSDQRGRPVVIIPEASAVISSSGESAGKTLFESEEQVVFALVYDDSGNSHFVRTTQEKVNSGAYVGDSKVTFTPEQIAEMRSGTSSLCPKKQCEQIVATANEEKKYERGAAGLQAAGNFFESLGQVGRTQGISSLLYPVWPLDEWAASVDKWFSRSVLNEEAWASGICYAQVFSPIDSQEDGVVFIENSYGNIQPIAHIFAEVSQTTSLLCDISEDGDETCPNDLECLDDGFCHKADGEHAEGFFYKVSWAVGAPADEAATPNINEDGTVLNYNVWLEPEVGNNVNFYESPISPNCPLKLVNGEQDGAVVTWWSNNDYTGEKVCIRWKQCGTRIMTTGGSANEFSGSTSGFFSEGRELDDPCNTIVTSTKNIAEIGSHNSVIGNNDADTVSVQTGDEDGGVSLNTDGLQ